MQRPDVRDAATGRWPGILAALGVDAAHLTGKHTACPVCGGKVERVEGESIVEVAPGLQPAAGERVIDAAGLVVAPGFILQRAAGFSQTDFDTGRFLTLTNDRQFGARHLVDVLSQLIGRFEISRRRLVRQDYAGFWRSFFDQRHLFGTNRRDGRRQ